MKRTTYLISLFALLPFAMNAQNPSTFEMRYITMDAKANGETDFHGETEWMDTRQRVDFLNRYADYSSTFWNNPKLDKSLLVKGEVTHTLQGIKPQPLTNVRRTIRLNDWQAYGYRQGKENEQERLWSQWTATPGTSITDGKLMLSKCVVTKAVGKIDWRFRFRTSIEKLASECTLSFHKGQEVVLSVKLTDGNVLAQSGNHAKSGSFSNSRPVHVEVYGDFPQHRFFVTINGGKPVECSIDSARMQEIDHISFASVSGESTIDEVLLFNFVEDKANRHTPFFTELLLDEDFEAVLPMSAWQDRTYDDRRWAG